MSIFSALERGENGGRAAVYGRARRCIRSSNPTPRFGGRMGTRQVATNGIEEKIQSESPHESRSYDGT
jgi:hypothetical protein